MRRRAPGVAVVGDVIVFGPGDPAGGEEERVELHAQRLSSHVLDWQLATGKNTERERVLILFIKNSNLLAIWKERGRKCFIYPDVHHYRDITIHKNRVQTTAAQLS